MKRRPGTGTAVRQSVVGGIGGGEQQQDLRLQRIGVLELVDEHVREARLEPAPHRLVASTRSRALSSRSRKSSAPARAFSSS